MNGCAVWSRIDRRLNVRESSAANHKLSAAFIRHTVAVEIARSRGREIACIRSPVAVAIRGTRSDFTTVQHAVAVAIKRRHRTDLAHIKNSVAIAIGKAASGDVA